MERDTGTLVTGHERNQLHLRRIRICVVDGPDTGLEYVLDQGTVIIGSAVDANLVLSDKRVSRRHLEAQLLDGGVRIRDLGSKNGVYNGTARVEQAVVQPGTVVSIGRTRLRLLADDQPIDLPDWPGDRLGEMVGSHPAMRRLFALIDRVAGTQATVLIEGETGVGKDLVARTLHQQSERCAGPFVVFDCASTAANLIASELFGVRRGAFTGAERNRRGAFAAAGGGTLFLNEIGELPLDVQPLLLGVLESREVRPVGGETRVPVDVRLVAATHRSLKTDVAKGRFRADLFYRLAVVSMHVPPLRDRPQDIPALVRVFLDRFASDLEPAPADLDALEEQPWPGNVRELRNLVERALALSGERFVLPGADRSGIDGSAPSYREAREEAMSQFERRYVVRLLREHKGNVSGAARTAGIARNYLHRLIKKLEIEKSEYSR